MSQEPRKLERDESVDPQTAAEQLPAWLSRAVRTLRWLRVVQWAGLAVFLATVVAITWAAATGSPGDGSGPMLRYVAAMLLYAACALGPWWMQARIARRVARSADADCFGPLLAAIARKEVCQTREMVQALTRLVERFGPREYAQLPSSQRRALTHPLTFNDRYFWAPPSATRGGRA